MTFEEYKLKYPEYFFINNSCYIITELNKLSAKQIKLSRPLWTSVWDIDVIHDEVRFGNESLSDEHIQDIMALKNTLVNEYKESNKQYKLKEKEKERQEKKARIESTIKWRLKKIAELEDEIDIHKHRIKCEENDLKKLIAKEQQ